MAEYIWLLILSILGFFISYHIWSKNKKREKITCCIGDDCNLVVKSKYGKIFGFDNSIMGMLYYVFIFAIGLAQFLFPEFFALSFVVLGKIVISGGSVLFSVYLTFIQLGILKKKCEYCIASALISAGIFAVIFLSQIS